MKISFVIPAYNTAHFLPAAVKSCLEQDHKDLEVVIVDDGSTDMTGQYLDWLEKTEKRVVIVRSPKNMGRSAARNLGNQASTGKVIFVLDADDISEPSRVKLCLQKIREGADYVFGDALMIDAVGHHLAKIKCEPVNKEKCLSSLTNQIVHSAVCYTREFAQKYPYEGLEVSKQGIDDWAQQIQAIINGEKMVYIPSVLSLYRATNAGIMNNRKPEEVEKAKKDFLELILAPSRA